MTNFKGYNTAEQIIEHLTYNDFDAETLLNALDLTELELVEQYAEDNGLPSSEGELSDRFNDDELPRIKEAIGRPGIELLECDIEYEFGIWTDSLCKDGEIHLLQYETYEWTGE